MTVPSVVDLVRRVDTMTADQRAAFLEMVAERGGEFGVHPLAPAQRGLWFLAQMYPESPAYTVPYLFTVSGPIDVPALRRAFRQVAERHEALRTVFPTLGGVPWQVVQELDRDVLTVEEAVVASEDRASYLTERAAAEAAQPFDLLSGPLWRAQLVRFEPEEAALLVTLHHIVCDGWSVGVIFTELAQSYAAAVRGVTAELPSVAMRYGDFARDQAAPQLTPRWQQLVRFWTDHLEGAPPVLELPTDSPRPATPDPRGALFTFNWPDELLSEVTSFAEELGVTPFVVLYAALCALLHRYAGDDVVVGAALANRTRAEAENAVGMFVNILPLRSQADRETTFRSLVGQARHIVTAAYRHQEMPFEALVDAMQLPRDVAHHPFFQVLIGVEHTGSQQLLLPDVTVQRQSTHGGVAKFDLTISVEIGERTIGGWIEYRCSLLSGQTIERMAEHLRNVLSAGLWAPDRPLWSLPMLTAADEQAVAHQRHLTGPVPADDRLPYELFEAQADRTPDAIAVEMNDVRLTYRQLDDAANELADRLRAVGAGPERLVAILLERSVDFAVAALAAWKTGAGYLPLDATLPERRVHLLVTDAAPLVVVTRGGLRAMLPQTAGVLDLDAALPSARPISPVRRPRTAGPGNTAYVIYTSGSTGRPKGVVVSHGSLTALCASMNPVLGLGPQDRVLQFASIGFDAAVAELVTALTTGARLVFTARSGLQPGPDLESTMRDLRITMVILAPSTVALMRPDRLPDLRLLLIGTELVPPQLIADWAPGRTVFNAYGPTEATVITTLAHCSGLDPVAPIGLPLAGVDAYVLDEYLNPVPRGVRGELYLGGALLARGYLDRPGLTAERFVPDRFSGVAGSRLYRTGDIVRHRQDGQLECFGRADGQVKIRGFRVEFGEIQHAVAAQPGVQTCVVLARRAEAGDLRLVAFVKAYDVQALDLTRLRRALRDLLPEYMVPAHLVQLPEIPQNRNGKVDLRALAEIDVESTDHRSTHAAPPTNDLERVILQVWVEVLATAAVGIDDNFFDVGGNSLLITKVRAALEIRLGRSLATLTLFQFPTVRQLAHHLSAPEPDPTPAAAGREVRASRRTMLDERSRRRTANVSGERHG